MIDRINLILRAKNITAKQFAEEIGIQPSGMSHILGGRNNPSLDFVNKVIRRYPEIDANWLLLGKGEMYGDIKNRKKEELQPSPEPTLFTSNSEPMSAPEPVEPDPEPETMSELEPEPNTILHQQEYKSPALDEEEGLESPEPIVKELPPAVKKGERRLVKILFCYDDRTFEEYTNLC